jgi:hypothetical protein
MARHVLGISWLHGWVQATSLAGDAVVANWIAPEPVNTTAEFTAALDRAVQETRFKGQRVAVVIDHRNLLFHVQETPPAKASVLDKVLERLVAQSQFFDEPAAWQHVELPASKNGHRCLLALLPQSLIRAIDDACAELNLQLVALIPPATVVARALKKLDAPAEETVILVTDLGGSLNMILGRTTGQLLLSRTVVLTGKLQSDRAAQELNRTLHYAQQQFGVNVSQVFIAGEYAYNSLKDIPVRAGLKIVNATGQDGPLDLPRQAAATTRKSLFNFAKHGDASTLALRVAAAIGLAALLIATFLTVFQVESTVRAREQEALTALSGQRADEQIQTAANVQRREATRLQAFLSVIGSTNDAPVAELFSRSLPSLVPDAIRLSEINVSQTASGWEFQLKGTVQDSNNNLSETLETLERSLQQSLFHAKVTDSTQQQLFRGDLAESSAPPRRGVREVERPFFVKGVLP